MRKLKYTKELLEEIVSKSVSLAQVIRSLSLKESGSSYTFVKRKLREFNIDTFHFLGTSTNSGVNHKCGTKKHFSEILIYRETENKRQKAFVLRRALIESGRPYKCEICNQIDQWNNQELRLQVDHQDNNWLNDRAENLRFLCPNCHSQQKHKMNQGLTGIISTSNYYRKKTRQKYGFPENYVFQIPVKKSRSTKINWPETSILFKMVEETSYTEVGKTLGVSDNSVRKRLKNH